MTDLKGLLERVEKAEGPDREIDAEIWLALVPGTTRKQWSYIHKASGKECFVDETRDATHALINVPSYTASIDAAVALVEKLLPGWRLMVTTPGGAYLMSSDFEPAEEEWGEPKGFTCAADAKSPALALIAALLRALIAQQEPSK